MHACMHACMHAYIHTYIHTYIHACIHACMHACMHAYIHTYIPIYVCMYVCIYIYIYVTANTAGQLKTAPSQGSNGIRIENQRSECRFLTRRSGPAELHAPGPEPTREASARTESRTNPLGEIVGRGATSLVVLLLYFVSSRETPTSAAWSSCMGPTQGERRGERQMGLRLKEVPQGVREMASGV